METYGRTWDGTEIVQGLVVFTNEMRVGKVETPERYSPGWFTVRYRNGGDVLQDATRVATAFQGVKALDVYARGHDWHYPGGRGVCALCGEIRTDEDANGRCPEAGRRP